MIEDRHSPRTGLPSLPPWYFELSRAAYSSALPLLLLFAPWVNVPIYLSTGCYDGNVYERLYKMALRAPLNTTEVFPQHYGEFERFLDKEYLARGNRSLNEPEASL